MKNRIIPLMLISTLALMAVSCDEDEILGRGRSGNRIQAVVSALPAQTRSELPGEDARFIGRYTLDGFGADSLCIAVYEFSNRDLPKELYSAADHQTRGAVVTTDNINQAGKQFTMSAWLESQNRNNGGVEPADATDYHFMKEATATCDGTAWTLSCASSTSDNWDIWRNRVPTNFWSVYPVSAAGRDITYPGDQATDEEQKTLSFDYTLPAPCTDAPYQDAENQPDLCFAYSRKAHVAVDDIIVHNHFYHALSAVYFDVTGVLSTNLMVKKIGFNNVYSSGHCEATGTLGESDGNPGVSTMVWSDQSSLKNYKQEYVSADFIDDGVNDDVLNFAESSKVYMMIPGQLDANAELMAEFYVYGDTVERSGNISSYEGEPVVWRPGYKYLYQISFTTKIRYKYTVHYLLWDDYLKGKETKVADDEIRYVTTLPIEVTEPAKTGTDLKPKYRNPDKYRPKFGSSVTTTITRDGQEITIWYEPTPHGQ